MPIIKPSTEFDDNAVSLYSGWTSCKLVRELATKFDAYSPEIINASSTGHLEGGILALGTNPNTYKIEAGRGVFVNGSVVYVEWDEVDNLTPLFGGLVTYVSLDSAAQVVLSASPLSNTERRTQIYLGVIVHVDTLNITGVNNQQAIVQHPCSQFYDLARALGQFKISGLKIIPDVAALGFGIGAGSAFILGANFENNEHDPHVVNYPLEASKIFQYRFSDGTNYTGLTETLIQPDVYDSGVGTAESVGNNKYTVQHVYHFSTGLVKIQLGQNQYPTSDDASASIGIDPFTTEPSILGNGLLIAYIVIKKGETDLSNALIIPAGAIGNASGGGDGVGYDQSLNTTDAVTFATINGVDPADYLSVGGDGIVLTGNSIAVDYNTTNIKITSGEVNTIQDISSTSTPTFSQLSLVNSSGYGVIELKGSTGAYIDFGEETSSDYDARIIRYDGANGAWDFVQRGTGALRFAPNLVTVWTIYNSFCLSAQPIRIPDGTVSVPALAFSDDTNTGIYSPSADAVAITCGGVNILQVNGGVGWIETKKQVRAIDGTVSSPAYSFTSSTNSGMWRDTSNRVCISAGGNRRYIAGDSDNHYFLTGTGDGTVRVIITETTLKPNYDNVYDLGNAALRFDDVYATNGTIQTSDERLKQNIVDSPLGLEFINKLRSVSFVWRDTVSTHESTGEETVKTHSRPHLGLIAQEVLTALDECGQTITDNDILSNDYIRDGVGVDRYGMRYSALISPLIKAVQELTTKVETLTYEKESLEYRIRTLEENVYTIQNGYS